MKPLLALALLLAACGSSDDPFTADMKMICSAGQDDSLPPEFRRQAAFREISTKIRTPDAARFVASLVQVAPAERPALLREALGRAKLSRCPFLDGY